LKSAARGGQQKKYLKPVKLSIFPPRSDDHAKFGQLHFELLKKLALFRG
jgi:hypothetical protein